MTVYPNEAVARAIAYGEGFIGEHEQDRSNRVYDAFIHDIDNYWWWEYPPPANNLPDWCASYVSHCIREGLRLPDWRRESPGDGRHYPTFAPRLAGHPFERWLVNVTHLEQWAQRHDMMLAGPDGQPAPEPGAVFLQRTNGGRAHHTGFVHSLTGGGIRTLEGNWGKRCTQRTIDLRPNRDRSTYTFFKWW